MVLLLHRPLYVAYPHKSNRIVGDHLRASLERLLLRHRVDLTIAGHVHAYFRTCAVAGGNCVPRGGPHGIVHVVIGNAGHELSDISASQEDWLEVTADIYGFGRFHVHSEREMRVELVASVGGDVVDQFTVRASAARLAMCGGGARASWRRPRA